MSSVRDEEPDTVPPPAGEEDAYSATTKVGAMPAELMARLRAEGLLPDANLADNALAAPPRRTAVVPRPAPRPQPQVSAVDDVPALSSEPPPPSGAPAPVPAHAPPLTPESATSTHGQSLPPGAPAPAAAPLEASAAFVSLPPASPLAAPDAGEPGARAGGPSEAVRAVGGRPKLQTIAVLVGAIVALVAFAFAMALMSRRR